MAVTTKDEERRALEKIKKIVNSLGENSYVGTAFEGCFEIAQSNIENDFGCSMKQNYQEAMKTISQLNQDNEQLRKQIDNINKETENRVDSLNDTIMNLRNENEKLKLDIDKELDWKECNGNTKITQDEYFSLSQKCHQLKWNEAKEIINREYGFDIQRIKICESVITKYEINKYNIKRIKEQYSRPAIFGSDSQNYIRFECCGHSYEMVNGILYNC